jgi:hypothetical protein
MVAHGQIQNGVVILDQGIGFPEGTRVAVSPLPVAVVEPRIECIPGQLPLVHGGVPGSLNLTNERIAEIFEQEDIEAMKGRGNGPS